MHSKPGIALVHANLTWEGNVYKIPLPLLRSPEIYSLREQWKFQNTRILKCKSLFKDSHCMFESIHLDQMLIIYPATRQLFRKQNLSSSVEVLNIVKYSFGIREILINIHLNNWFSSANRIDGLSQQVVLFQLQLGAHWLVRATINLFLFLLQAKTAGQKKRNHSPIITKQN